MADPTFDVIIDETTLRRLASQLSSYPSAARLALRDFGLTAKKIIQGVTPVGKARDIKDKSSKGGKKFYKGGNAKKKWKVGKASQIESGWEIPIENTALSTDIDPDAKPYPYVASLEFGSKPGKRPWPNPRKRTQFGLNPETGERRVYSRQAVGGIAHRAWQRIDIRWFTGALIRQMERS